MADLPDSLQPPFLLAAYAAGYFPMDDGPDDAGDVRWYEPDPRAILPLHPLDLPRSALRALRRNPYELRLCSAFEDVVRACARPRGAEDGVWISERFVRAYTRLAGRGYALSFEAWRDGVLVGGLYGVAIGRAFMAESMFHTAHDAGNVVLAWSASFLRDQGFLVYDVQFATPHLARFGVTEVPREEYRRLVREATGS